MTAQTKQATSMRSIRARLSRLKGGYDDTPWAMERRGGNLEAADGQTMTDAEYLERWEAGKAVPFLWFDEAPKEDGER